MARHLLFTQLEGASSTQTGMVCHPPVHICGPLQDWPTESHEQVGSPAHCDWLVRLAHLSQVQPTVLMHSARSLVKSEHLSALVQLAVPFSSAEVALSHAPNTVPSCITQFHFRVALVELSLRYCFEQHGT
ncbi:Uncharacterised protein [uncultured archaeon]|nr:Uncharacterised protein [uncultured archaeon]